MEKSMIELIPRSNSREPFSGRASSQEYQLIAVHVIILDGYSLLVFVDIIESRKFRIYVREQCIFVNKRSALLFRQPLWLKLPGDRSTGMLS